MGLFSSLFGNSNYNNLSYEEFKQQIESDKNAVLIDVRTKEEYRQGHIPKAKNIDISSSAFPKEIEKLHNSKSYYVYCRSGARSRSACSHMSKAGLEQVNNLSGGILSWKGKLER